MSRARPTSQLEHLILARIDRDGPLTAYRVRSLFDDSPTDALSSSTGSVYPAIRRLEARGLLRAGPEQDGRRSRLLEVTAEGRREVMRWLRSDRGLGHLAEDPLRTRALFAARLPTVERRRWLRRAIEASEAKLVETVEFHRQLGAPTSDRWAHENAIRLLRARIEWLQDWLQHEETPAGRKRGGDGDP